MKQGAMTREQFLDKLTGRETYEKTVVLHRLEQMEEIDLNPALLAAKIECEQRNIQRYQQRIEECQRRIAFYEQALAKIEPKEDAP